MSVEYTETERNDMAELAARRIEAKSQSRSGNPANRALGESLLRAIAVQIAGIHDAAKRRAGVS